MCVRASARIADNSIIPGSSPAPHSVAPAQCPVEVSLPLRGVRVRSLGTRVSPERIIAQRTRGVSTVRAPRGGNWLGVLPSCWQSGTEAMIPSWRDKDGRRWEEIEQMKTPTTNINKVDW